MNGIYGYYDKEKRYVVYIGQDSNIDKNRRHKQHLQKSNYNKQKINSVLQNNPNRYDYFVLIKGNFSDYALNDMEKQVIDIFKTYYYDYPERSVFNFTKGGNSNPSKIPEIAQKISKANSGKNNPNYGKDFSGKNNPNYGNPSNYHHSEEIKRRISTAHTKNYTRIIKYGFHRKKQQYAIKKDEKKIKYSIDKEKLKKWFKENHPNEILIDETRINN